MAQVRPFRGLRYSTSSKDISSFCAPPYDVQTGEDRDRRLAINPRNVLGLELAAGAEDLETPHNRYVTASETWDAWQADGSLLHDDKPALYLLRQDFVTEDGEHSRTSVICEARLHAFEERVVLPHERTLPKALGDRYRLIKATRANFSQVFGLYTEQDDGYASFVEGCERGIPDMTALEDDGTRDSLWMITDPSLISAFTTMMADKQVYIADGHHRYTTALAYRDEQREERYGCKADSAPSHADFDDEAGSEYVMMALSNMDDPQLVVLPYHRAALSSGEFDPGSFLRSLEERFTVSRPEDPSEALAGAKGFSFLFDRGDGDLLAEAKEGSALSSLIDDTHSEGWKELDVVLLQELVIGPLLDIRPDDPTSLQRLSFSHDIHHLKELVRSGDRSVAFTLRPTRLDQLRAVSLAGETMPQKSTYFYPKLPSGFVMRSMGR